MIPQLETQYFLRAFFIACILLIDNKMSTRYLKVDPLHCQYIKGFAMLIISGIFLFIILFIFFTSLPIKIFFKIINILKNTPLIIK